MTKSCIVPYQVYPHWHIKSPPSPPRSRLFRLEPIGVGTAKVESLTSYVARLSEAHCVSSHLLLCREIYPSIGKRTCHYSGSLGFSASQVNGVGKIAETTVTALEQLTYRDDIRHMTLLTWANIFSPIGLLRTRRAWCTVCHEERIRERKPLYEPLIWALEAVSVCPWHHEWLREICQRCNHPLPVLASFSYPGYCSRCGGWLGSLNREARSDHLGVPSISKEELARQASMTNSICELLTRASALTVVPAQEKFIANFSKNIDQVAGGSINYFSTVVGLWSGMIRRLLSGTTKLRLPVLLQISSRLNIPPFNLLSDTDNQKALKGRTPIPVQGTSPAQKPVSWDEVKRKLRLAAGEHPPPSLEAVAQRMGYYPARLSKNFPRECNQIANRYYQYRKSKHPNHRKISRVLRAALKEEPPPSLQKVLRRLGCQSTGYYYYYNYPELCLAVAERFKNYRNKPFNIETDRERLQAALIEQPPPAFSEVARRLCHNREFIRRKFPELSKEIALRYIAHRDTHRKLKAERLRNEIRLAIKQITASELYASEARVREHVKKRLTNLGRDILFKQALREVKTEMGLNK